MSGAQKKIYAGILVCICICSVLPLFAEYNRWGMPDSVMIRREIEESWLYPPMSVLQDKQPEVRRNEAGELFEVRAEENGDRFSVIIAPRESISLSVYSDNGVSTMISDVYPAQSYGSWILTKNIADNSFAIWVFNRVLKGEVFTLARMKELLQQNQLPMMFVSAKKYAEAKYSKTLGTNPLADWKLCHIERVGFNTKKSIYDLDISAIQDHFRKYADPNNMFVLPKEIGALGEIESFISAQKIWSDILKKH